MLDGDTRERVEAMNNRRLEIRETDMPGLYDATLIDGAGFVMDSFIDLTTGQVHAVAEEYEADIVTWQKAR